MITFLEWRSLNEQVTQDQLNKILLYVEALFKKFNVSVEWSRHFLERVNDLRNKPEIKASEIIDIFNKEFRQHGATIARMSPGDEILMKDLSTDINLPVGLHWDRNNKRMFMRPITIIRKKNFGSDNFNSKLLVVK